MKNSLKLICGALRIEIRGGRFGKEIDNIAIQHQADLPIGWLGELPNKGRKGIPLAKNLKVRFSAKMKIGDHM
jgi:hypothetical protein